MKIGIITLYYGGNFGTYFQAVCLQKQIQKLGHECEIVSASIRGIQPWKYYLLLCFNRFVPKQLKRVLSKPEFLYRLLHFGGGHEAIKEIESMFFTKKAFKEI